MTKNTHSAGRCPGRFPTPTAPGFPLAPTIPEAAAGGRVVIVGRARPVTHFVAGRAVLAIRLANLFGGLGL